MIKVRPVRVVRQTVLPAVLSALLLGFSACGSDDPADPVVEPLPSIVVNEFMAGNDSGLQDENGDYDDWIELYNTTDEPIDVGGYYITDNLNAGPDTWWRIPLSEPDSTTIAAKGYLVMFADRQPNQGVRHLNIRLRDDGEDIGLYTGNAMPVQEISYDLQVDDVSCGRFPDGSGDFCFLSSATPGESNQECFTNVPPAVESLILNPQNPAEGETVTVTVQASDYEGLQGVILYYAIDDGAWIEMPLDLYWPGTYGGEIPAQDFGTTVYYYVVVTDIDGLTVEYPAGAPQTADVINVDHYLLDFVLHINEFLASNNAGLQDEHGEFEDWIEIYNPGDQDIDLGGQYISDDLDDPTMWQIPVTAPASTTVPAGGFLVLFADRDIQQGVLHLDLKLGSGGEQIGLFAGDEYAHALVDSVTFPSQTTDVSYGRTTDGAETWTSFTDPTPGVSNISLRK